jgi:hypothetical protein
VCNIVQSKQRECRRKNQRGLLSAPSLINNALSTHHTRTRTDSGNGEVGRLGRPLSGKRHSICVTGILIESERYGFTPVSWWRIFVASCHPTVCNRYNYNVQGKPFASYDRNRENATVAFGPRLKRFIKYRVTTSSFLTAANRTARRMESAESSTSSHVPSDRAVAESIRQGLQDVVIQSVGGFIVGGLAGIVLARGGGHSSARKVLAGFGGGVGCGIAWTRTSMRLEDMLRVPDPKK